MDNIKVNLWLNNHHNLEVVMRNIENKAVSSRMAIIINSVVVRRVRLSSTLTTKTTEIKRTIHF